MNIACLGTDKQEGVPFLLMTVSKVFFRLSFFSVFSGGLKALFCEFHKNESF